jgi:hypothetical protein
MYDPHPSQRGRMGKSEGKVPTEFVKEIYRKFNGEVKWKFALAAH